MDGESVPIGASGTAVHRIGVSSNLSPMGARRKLAYCAGAQVRRCANGLENQMPPEPSTFPDFGPPDLRTSGPPDPGPRTPAPRTPAVRTRSYGSSQISTWFLATTGTATRFRFVSTAMSAGGPSVRRIARPELPLKM